MATEATEEVTYPRWVKRDPTVGAVLCLTAVEEAKLLAEWKARPKPPAEKSKEEK